MVLVFFKPQPHCIAENEVILIVFAVSSTFVGTAGLSIIANGVAFALGEVYPLGFGAGNWEKPPLSKEFWLNLTVQW